ncbi:MAG: hypothetical protein EXS31_12260 [Pedosphaera sp.]|nr:hypothetical protein [Pedosphaera sp.]
MKTTMQQITNWKNWKAMTALLTLATVALTLTTGAGKLPPGPSDIPLKVTIEAFGLVASDGLGDYRNGEKGVSLQNS